MSGAVAVRSDLPRVLIADDERLVCDAYARTLRRAGYEVVTAADGEQATQLLAESRFDVVVSDIAMPRMSGVELLRRVREHDVDLPVVLVTAGQQLAPAVEAVRHGAMRYLSKPVSLGELRDVVADAVRAHHLALAKREGLALVAERKQKERDRADRRTRLERGLSHLWMAYQPIVSWPARSVFAHEALVRSDDLTMSTPSALFEAAEGLDAVRELGRCIRAAAAGGAARTPLPLFVNLHGSELLDETLYRSDGPLGRVAARVVLEITERIALDDVPTIEERVERLRAMGFRIAIDDLGAGYAGLSSIARLRPDFVKLDSSLVRGIERDPVRQRLVASMLMVCRDLGIRTIVEGVETCDERDALVGLGAELLQGYLFARPARAFPPVTFP